MLIFLPKKLWKDLSLFVFIFYNFSISMIIISQYPTNTPRGFHFKTTWKRSFPRRFNVESTWCVCRVVCKNFTTCREIQFCNPQFLITVPFKGLEYKLIFSYILACDRLQKHDILQISVMVFKSFTGIC